MNSNGRYIFGEIYLFFCVCLSWCMGFVAVFFVTVAIFFYERCMVVDVLLFMILLSKIQFIK